MYFIKIFLCCLSFCALFFAKLSSAIEDDEEIHVVQERGYVERHFIPNDAPSASMKKRPLLGKSTANFKKMARTKFTSKQLEATGSYENFLKHKRTKLQGYLLGYENPLYTPDFSAVPQEGQEQE